jgi:DivIVA domain-containing protein
MAESQRRTAGSPSRLTPEEITNRGFASAFRGISETEVRNFLKRVADEIAALRNRDTELQQQVADLEEQVAHPPAVTEEQLLSSLGEETARVLRSAQGAAEEIRKRAEERAGELVREAQENATKTRDDADEHSKTLRAESEQQARETEEQAQAAASELRDSASRDAEEMRARATSDTEAAREAASVAATTELEKAKASGRALVDEARTVRERVLADLGRRRSLLQAQVDELRSGRDRLLDAYRIVKRTLSDATDALAQVEARANQELGGPAPRVTIPPVEGELEILERAPAGAPVVDHPAGDADAEIDLEAEAVVDLDRDAEPEPGTDAVPGEHEDSGAAVDALFARLRASHVEAPETEPEAGVADAEDADPEAEADAPAGAGAETGAKAPAAEETEAEEEPAGAEAAVDEPAAEPDVELTDEDPAVAGAEDEAGEPDEERSPDDVLRAERDEILGPLTKDLGRRAKRALQDEQNELLDQIRTRKGTIAAADVLPALDAQEAAWLEVLEEPLRTAYAKASEDIAIDGRRGGEGELPADLLIELATVMVGAWRERLVAAIDGAAEDPDAITQALGARYREYRGQELDRALGDALAAAWARGAYAAVPDGTMLRWVPAEVGRCPDCDDNALEPTARNEPFPTGQQFPPAHPGCRCFLAVVEPAAVSQ